MKKVLSSTVHESHGLYRCNNCIGKIGIGEQYHRDETTKEKLCDCCFEIEDIADKTGGKDEK